MRVDSRTTLDQYARRRSSLSGADQLRHEFPFGHAFDPQTQQVSGVVGKLVSFAHYDYLALGSDHRILAAAKNAVDQLGVGVGASRVVGGERSLHADLERELAAFIGTESALSLVSGYGTNVTLISHLLARSDLILYDEASHNSIMAGTEQSRAQAISFAHNDLDELAGLLRSKRQEFCRVLIVVEGLYSMDGDIPDLPRLLQLCRDYDAWLMIDEAHSIGVLGKTGGGITEYYGIDAGEVDLIVGTLSKAFLSCGGFVAGKTAVIEWLRASLPGFVYSVGLPPSSVAAAREALSILIREPERLDRLIENSRYFRDAARARGLDCGHAIGSAVVPLMFPDTATALEASKSALAAGYFVPPIVRMAVPKNLPRLRFFITAGHDRAQIDGVLDTLAPLAAYMAGRDLGTLENASKVTARRIASTA